MIYRMKIPGMKPVLVRGSSKAKALDQLVEVESLTGEQMADALDSGEKVYKSGDRVEADAPPAKDEAPAVRVHVESGMIQKRDPGQAGVAVGYRDDRPATLAELTEADAGATYQVDPKGGMVQRQPQGTDAWEDIRAATPEEIAAAKKK
jgi:hypothetical protein